MVNVMANKRQHEIQQEDGIDSSVHLLPDQPALTPERAAKEDMRGVCDSKGNLTGGNAKSVLQWLIDDFDLDAAYESYGLRLADWHAAFAAQHDYRTMSYGDTVGETSNGIIATKYAHLARIVPEKYIRQTLRVTHFTATRTTKSVYAGRLIEVDEALSSIISGMEQVDKEFSEDEFDVVPP